MPSPVLLNRWRSPARPESLWREGSLLSIGACDVDDESKWFSIELKPINNNADPKALEVTGLSLEELTECGSDPQQATSRSSGALDLMSSKREIFISVDVETAGPIPGEFSCLIPRFDGAILSLEWKEALWDKFVMAAPRPRPPSEQQ